MIGILRTTVLVGAAALFVAAALPHLFNKPMLADNAPEQSKVQYELQEKCAKDASEFLDRAKAGKVVGALLGVGYGEKQTVAENSNRYSTRFNKCFIWMDDTLTNQTNGADEEEQISVWDVKITSRLPISLLFLLKAIGA